MNWQSYLCLHAAYPPEHVNSIQIKRPNDCRGSIKREYCLLWYINVREHRRGNQKRKIQRNWQHRVHKMKKNKTKHNTTCDGHHYMQSNTNNKNKTTGGKAEPNIVIMQKS
jgi:hypothetical protein